MTVSNCTQLGQVGQKKKISISENPFSSKTVVLASSVRELVKAILAGLSCEPKLMYYPLPECNVLPYRK